MDAKQYSDKLVEVHRSPCISRSDRPPADGNTVVVGFKSHAARLWNNYRQAYRITFHELAPGSLDLNLFQTMAVMEILRKE
jgi:hypothetical protein